MASSAHALCLGATAGTRGAGGRHCGRAAGSRPASTRDVTVAAATPSGGAGSALSVAEAMVRDWPPAPCHPAAWHRGEGGGSGGVGAQEAGRPAASLTAMASRATRGRTPPANPPASRAVPPASRRGGRTGKPAAGVGVLAGGTAFPTVPRLLLPSPADHRLPHPSDSPTPRPSAPSPPAWLRSPAGRRTRCTATGAATRFAGVWACALAPSPPLRWRCPVICRLCATSSDTQPPLPVPPPEQRHAAGVRLCPGGDSDGRPCRAGGAPLGGLPRRGRRRDDCPPGGGHPQQRRGWQPQRRRSILPCCVGRRLLPPRHRAATSRPAQGSQPGGRPGLGGCGCGGWHRGGCEQPR